MGLKRNIGRIAVSAVMATVFTGCSMIDEDLSNCGKEVVVEYDVELITNWRLELEMQLDTQTDKELIDLLREYMGSIFTDFAHDVDLSFYDTQGDSTRLLHDQHIMDANQRRYVLHLPIHQYHHLAAANLVNNTQVSIAADEHCHPARLEQLRTDTIAPHTTGLFTARQPIHIMEGIDQTFYVRLFMANCASALVVDPRGWKADDIRVVASGFASQYLISDSAFVFGSVAPVVTTDRLVPKTDPRICYCTVNFPSRESSTPLQTPLLRGAGNAYGEASQTRTVIETNDPFIAKPGEQSLWEYRVYVTNADGTVTESIVGMREPLRAGQLKIVQVWIGDDGRVMSNTPEVGISVTLDWKPGNTYNPEI